MFEKLLEVMLAALLGAGGAALADTPFGTEGEDDTVARFSPDRHSLQFRLA